MSAQIIQLFKRPKPPTEDSEWWKWGQEFVEDGVNELETLVDDMKECTTEEGLRRSLRELRAIVEGIPSLD